MHRIWFTDEKGFEMGSQSDNLPEYAGCDHASYRKVSCAFESSDNCSWLPGSPGNWVTANQSSSSMPFAISSGDLYGHDHMMILKGTPQSRNILETDYIGPLRTVLQFSLYIFGRGIESLRLWAQTRENHFLLWDSMSSNNTHHSLRRWQNVSVDICLKFPFKLVFEASTGDEPYVCAIDDIVLVDECSVLQNNVACPDLLLYTSMDQDNHATTTPIPSMALSPPESGDLNCSFSQQNFCNWTTSANDQTAWAILSVSDEFVAVVNCTEIPKRTVTAYLLSPNTSCAESNACFFKFRYRGSEGKVVQLQLYIVTLTDTLPFKIWDSQAGEIPEWLSAKVNLTTTNVPFWLTFAVTFYEDNSSTELDDFQFARDDAPTLPPTAATGSWLPLYGNLIGIISLAVVIIGIIFYRRWYSKITYYSRLAFCDVPDSLLREFELPSNAVTLISQDLRTSHFCRIGVARISAARDQSLSESAATVAVKFLDDKHTPEEERCFIAEMATFMRVGRHPNIVNLIAVVLKGRPMIVMEYCPHGSLYQYLQNLKADNAETEITADVDFLLSKLQQIAIGMAFLTTRGILHRDLAARNVLLDDNLTAKISDFGLARARSEYILQRPNIKLPLGWMAPETLIPGDGRYSEKSDVWSFGVITWECFTYGQTPYSQSFPLGLDVDGLSQFLLSGQRLILPETCPDWMRALVADCWSWEVSGRLSFKEIVSLMGKYSKVANPEEEIETL